MNQHQAAKALPLIKALAEGKTLQIRGRLDNKECWIDAQNPDPAGNDHLAWRIKPEPQLRAWTLKEMPIGAIIRRKDTHATNIPQLIIAADILAHKLDDGSEMPAAVVKFESADNVTSEKLLARWEWQYPGDGLAWLPCGIEVPE